MRLSFIISLLFLYLFLTKAQGIRLEKGSYAVKQHKQLHDEESNLLKRSKSDDKEAILCKDEKCTAGKIKNRKLVTTSISTTDAISKNVKSGGNEAYTPANGIVRNDKVNREKEEMKVNMFTASKQQMLHHEQYPDLADIAEMDYSPARKKTPIHN